MKRLKENRRDGVVFALIERNDGRLLVMVIDAPSGATVGLKGFREFGEAETYYATLLTWSRNEVLTAFA